MNFVGSLKQGISNQGSKFFKLTCLYPFSRDMCYLLRYLKAAATDLSETLVFFHKICRATHCCLEKSCDSLPQDTLYSWTIFDVKIRTPKFRIPTGKRN